MKKGILIVYMLQLLSVFSALAQNHNDTIYLDKFSSYVSTRDSAEYYRLMTYNSDSLYHFVDRTLDGKMRQAGTLLSIKPDVEEGRISYFDDSGRLESQRHYTKGVVNGEWREYYPSGQVWYVVNYQNGKRQGKGIIYYETGEVKEIETLNNDTIVEGKGFTRAGTDTVFHPFLTMPDFPGGQMALLKFLATTTVYPQYAKENDIEGTVYVQFLIDTSGEVSHVAVLRSIEKSLDKEAVRVISLSPKWIPGTQDGKPVNVYYTVPIRFVFM